MSRDNSVYIDIDIDIDNNANQSCFKKIKMVPVLITAYLLVLSIGEIVLSYAINKEELPISSSILRVDLWFVVQGIISVMYVFFAYTISYYRYKTKILQSISHSFNLQEKYDFIKIIYYGLCLTYQVFMVIWIIIGTILILMNNSFTANPLIGNIAVSMLFFEYVTLITFMKLVLSIHLLE